MAPYTGTEELFHPCTLHKGNQCGSKTMERISLLPKAKYLFVADEFLTYAFIPVFILVVVWEATNQISIDSGLFQSFHELLNFLVDRNISNTAVRHWILHRKAILFHIIQFHMRQFAYSTACVPAEEYYISKIFVILPTCPYGPILRFAVEPLTVFSGIWQVSVFSHFALGFGFLRFWQDITKNYLIWIKIFYI